MPDYDPDSTVTRRQIEAVLRDLDPPHDHDTETCAFCWGVARTIALLRERLLTDATGSDD